MKTLKQISLLCLFWMIGMSVSAYDFTATNADGVTIYYNITSSTSPKTVEVTNDGNTSTSVYTAETINIPNTVSYGGNTYGVTGIGEKAFYNAKTVKSITLPKFLTSLGNYAFSGCSGLTSITIPNSVTSISSYAFSGCSGLISITIPNSVTSIENFAFYGCLALTSITIPNSVTSISFYAFSGCSGLISITIPNSVTSIENFAFYGCYNLKSIAIPNSVTSIGDYAFWECNNLTSITIPNSVTSIGVSAFEDCHITSITIPNSVTSIGDYAFKECDELTSITIPNSVTSIGVGVFKGCIGLTSVTIPNSVTSIGNDAFYDCSALTSITIPNSVTSIGARAFASSVFGSCGLTSITIGNSVTSIGRSAFEDCRGLTSITIPNSVTSIELCTFSGCSGLTSITIPNSVTSIGSNAFEDCRGLTSVTIPNSVTSIGDRAFQNCSGLTSVTIPNSVTSIGDYAFNYCGLTSITVEDGNTYYDSREGCNAIIEKSSNTLIIGCKNTIIPNSVTSIGKYAFSGCSLTSLTIPNSVTSIGGYAFSGCSGLTSITIPNSVTSIGGYAFSGCSGLTSILTSKETSLGTDAFGDVQKVYYPKLGAYSVSGSQYIPYTNIAIGSDGSVAAETLDDWSEFEIKDAGKEYIVPVELNYYFLGASYSRSFNNHEWQSWYVPVDVPFSSLSANFEVAKFSDTQASADEIEIESVTSGTLTANTPYLVRLKDDKATGEYSIVADESAGLKETVENEFNIGSNYKLKTTYRELSGEELKGKYALSEGKFKKAGDSATLKPFRVYLEPVTTGAADVLDLVMDGATDITLTPSSGKGAETIYNLNGQAVGEDYKGVVIKNGKKVFKN